MRARELCFSVEDSSIELGNFTEKAVIELSESTKFCPIKINVFDPYVAKRHLRKEGCARKVEWKCELIMIKIERNWKHRRFKVTIIVSNPFPKDLAKPLLILFGSRRVQYAVTVIFY